MGPVNKRLGLVEREGHRASQTSELVGQPEFHPGTNKKPPPPAPPNGTADLRSFGTRRRQKWANPLKTFIPSEYASLLFVTHARNLAMQHQSNHRSPFVSRNWATVQQHSPTKRCDPGAIDVTGIADTDGDGFAYDQSIAVLGKRSDGRIEVEVRRASDGFFLQSARFFNIDADPIAINSGLNTDGQSSIFVLAKRADGRAVVKSFNISDGTYGPSISFFSDDYIARDLIVFADGNSDNISGDPVIGVIAERKTTGNLVIKLRHMMSPSGAERVLILGDRWTGWSADALGDSPDLLATLGSSLKNGTLLIKTRTQQAPRR